MVSVCLEKIWHFVYLKLSLILNIRLLPIQIWWLFSCDVS